MGLEIGTTIQSLVSSNPTVEDPVSQGDDHIRLIKAVLKAIFPGVLGQGFATPITATEAQLNFVTGVTSNIQTQIDANKAAIDANTNSIASQGNSIITINASIDSINTEIAAINSKLIPAGSITLFIQASPPSGWTRVQGYDGRMITTGNLAAGGVHNPLVMNLVPSHTHGNNFSLSNSSDGAHSHTVEYTAISAAAPVQSGSGANAVPGIFTRSTSSSGTHTHAITVTGGITANSGADNWEPKYLSGLLCQKN